MEVLPRRWAACALIILTMCVNADVNEPHKSAAILQAPRHWPAKSFATWHRDVDHAAETAAALPTLMQRAQIHSECRAPENATAVSMWEASGHTTYGMGNYDSCITAGFDYCLLQVGGEGGIPVGLCMSTACASEISTCGSAQSCANTTSWLLAVETAPILGVAEVLSVPVFITCGTNAQAGWSVGAVTTVTVLSVLAAIVFVATIYAAISRPATATMKGGLLARLASRVSLSATVPPLVAAQPRRHRPGMANLGAVDGIRVLSLSTVILFHSFVFADPIPGFINSSVATNMAVLSPAGQVYSSAWLAVDSFFMLSGLLGAYLLTREVTAALPDWNRSPTHHADVGDAALVWASAQHVTSALRVALLRRVVAAPAHEALLDDTSKELTEQKETPQVDAAPSLSRTASSLAELYTSLFVHRFLRLFPSLLVALSILYYVTPMVSSGPYWYHLNQAVAPCSTSRFWYAAFFVANADPDLFCGVWFW